MYTVINTSFKKTDLRLPCEKPVLQRFTIILILMFTCASYNMRCLLPVSTEKRLSNKVFVRDNHIVLYDTLYWHNKYIYFDELFYDT